MGVLLNPYIMKPAAAGSAAITYGGFVAVAGTPSAVVTVPNVPIGTPSAGRRVFSLIHWYPYPGSRALLSATIGGLSAEIHIQRQGAVSGSVNGGVALISASVPSGVQANIVATFAGGASTYTASASAFAVVGLQNAVVMGSASTYVSNATAASLAVDVQAGGIVIGGLTEYSAATNFTSSGFARRYQSTIAANYLVVGAADNIATTESGKSLSFVAPSNFYGSAIAASFR